MCFWVQWSQVRVHFAWVCVRLNLKTYSAHSNPSIEHSFALHTRPYCPRQCDLPLSLSLSLSASLPPLSSWLSNSNNKGIRTIWPEMDFSLIWGSHLSHIGGKNTYAIHIDLFFSIYPFSFFICKLSCLLRATREQTTEVNDQLIELLNESMFALTNSC